MKKLLIMIVLISITSFICSFNTAIGVDQSSKFNTVLKDNKETTYSGAKQQPPQPKEDVLKKILQHYNNRLDIFKKENNAILANSNPKWKKQIVMLGDSITEGFDLKKYFPDKPIINRGISSDHIDWLDKKGLLYRMEPEVLAPHPSHIFILIGINELGDSLDLVDNYITNYRKLLSALKIKYPDAKIYVQSVLPARDKYARLNKGVLEFNLKLKTLSNELTIPYIDLYTRFKDEKGELKLEYSHDGLHLKEPAYAAWKKIIDSVLDSQ